MAGKISDPTALQSLDYWRAVTMVDKFLALPPGTPRPIVEVYRKAYRAIAADAEFTALGRKMSEVFAPMSDADVRSLVATVAGSPPPAIEYLDAMLRRQGISGL